MPYISNIRDEQETIKYFVGFYGGLNNIQDRSLVGDKFLSQALNCEVVVDGIRRRRGTKRRFNQNGNTKILGSAIYNDISSGVSYWLRIGNSGKLEKFVNGSWSVVSNSVTWDTNSLVEFVQIGNRMYIHNGHDNMRYFDGTNIVTYSQISTPTGLTVTPVGSPGTKTYSYRVEAFNKTGRTAACARVTINNGNDTLSATNYNLLTWNAVSGADGYHVFGRSPYGAGEAYLDTVYTNSYKDTGSDVPSYALLPNEYNTTGGIIAKKAIFSSLGRQIAFGVKEGNVYKPTRVYYSGTVEYTDAFVGGDYGGGWVEIGYNDGGEIVDIIDFQNSVIIFKNNGIFRLSFNTSGYPVVEAVNSYVGGVSQRCSKLIRNDIVFVGQKDGTIMVMTLGQQENFVGSQMRTNNVSAYVSGGMDDISVAYMKNIATFYFDYKFGFTYTTTGSSINNKAYVVDTRFGGWVEWNGLPTEATGYVVSDCDGKYKLFGMAAASGHMIELFSNDEISDDGQPFTTIVSTKAYNFGLFNVKKIFRNPCLWFKYMSGGTIKAKIYNAINEIVGVTTLTLNPDNSGIMVGSILAGSVLAGASDESIVSASSGAEYPQEISMFLMDRSIRFSIIDDNKNTDWLFLGVSIRYKNLVGMPLEQQYRKYLD